MILASHPDHRRRPGFTLVEILVVITILGILVALLVPAITGAVATAKNAQVTGEMNTIAQALVSFKSRYGDFPPSRIILSEDGNYNPADPRTLDQVTFSGAASSGFKSIGDNPSVLSPTYVGSLYYPNKDLTFGALSERSLRYLRKFFPRAPFRAGGGAGPTFDFNGSGAPLPDGLILAQGHECLVFCLGGIPGRVVGPDGSITIGMTGFSNNPQNPFVTEAAAPNRQRPMFEFKGERLVDDDGDGIPGYIDPLGSLDSGRYYAYFSAYGGGGYDPNDVNFALADDTISRPFRVNFTVGTPATNIVPSPAPNPFTISPAQPPANTAQFQNSETYQIISAGGDRFYGYGGQYTTSGQIRLPVDTDPPVPVPADTSIRDRERDNLTNFASSRLD